MSKKTPASCFEPYIPDCCNLGVVFRVLLTVSVVVLAGLWSRGDSVWLVLGNFMEASILIELICLCSLFLLCLCRRALYQVYLPPQLQRSLCALLPALVSWLAIGSLRSMDWFVLIFPRLDLAFVVLAAACAGLLFQQYFEMRTRAFSPALGEARLQALQARIRPHFLFNSLNTALSLIRTDPRRAEVVLEDLSDLFRILMRDTRTMISLRDELRLCEQYLAIETLRLGERLNVIWDRTDLADNDAREVEIPSLLLQPLIENAVHYGVEPSAEKSDISIQLKKSLNKIEIRIRNPQHARSGAPSGNQMALENIRQRLALLYDVEAGMSSMAVDGYFEVKLHFPARR